MKPSKSDFMADLKPNISDTFPKVFDFPEGTSVNDFGTWYQHNRSSCEQDLVKTGAMLFRGIFIRELADFESALTHVSPKFMNYVDGNSPRKKLSSNVYTSTEYDASQYITLHNELSYSSRWPATIFFCCVQPAELGGETPLADGRLVAAAMNPDIIEEFERKGINYIRNIHGGNGFSGRSWQETFETNDRGVVESFCHEQLIKFEWKKDGGLRLIQPRPATMKHPVTGEKVWFNQADQFHGCHLEKDVYETLMMINENNEEELPTHVTFGDGTSISKDIIHEITRTIDGLSVKTQWQKGDLLMVDNVLVSHGRMPYKGHRTVLVSMA